MVTPSIRPAIDASMQSAIQPASSAPASNPWDTAARWFDTVDGSKLLNQAGTQATNGQGVATWVSRAAAGGNAVNATGSRQFVLTSGQVAQTNTARNYLTLANAWTPGSAWTVYCVVTRPAAGGRQNFAQSGLVLSGIGLILNDDGGGVSWTAPAANGLRLVRVRKESGAGTVYAASTGVAEASRGPGPMLAISSIGQTNEFQTADATGTAYGLLAMFDTDTVGAGTDAAVRDWITANLGVSL